MKASEARICNWLKYTPDGLPFLVSEINCFKDPNSINGLSPEDVEPIPLSDDWLQRFGFKKFQHDHGGITYSRIEDLHPPNLGYRDERCTKIVEIYFTNSQPGSERYPRYVFKWGQYLEEAPGKDVTIQHVHQLQNLYFILTGSELT